MFEKKMIWKKNVKKNLIKTIKWKKNIFLFEYFKNSLVMTVDQKYGYRVMSCVFDYQL